MDSKSSGARLICMPHGLDQKEEFLVFVARVWSTLGSPITRRLDEPHQFSLLILGHSGHVPHWLWHQLSVLYVLASMLGKERTLRTGWSPRDCV